MYVRIGKKKIAFAFLDNEIDCKGNPVPIFVGEGIDVEVINIEDTLV